MILLIIVGTLPLFVVLPIKDLVEGLADNMYFVGGALLVTGCLLFASDRVRKGHKSERSARIQDVLVVGLAQAIATCPGISRSGTTITAGCFVGFDRKFAVRYSFLMSIPAILGANILSLKDAVSAGIIWRMCRFSLWGGRGCRCGICLHPAAEDDCRKGQVRILRLLLLGSRRGNADFEPAAELSIGGTYCGFLITKEIHFGKKARKFQRFQK